MNRFQSISIDFNRFQSISQGFSKRVAELRYAMDLAEGVDDNLEIPTLDVVDVHIKVDPLASFKAMLKHFRKQE